MFLQVKPQTRAMISSQKYIDLTLYFRELQIKMAKSLSCIQIYHNNLYVGTKEFLVYAYEIRQNSDLKLELFNQREFPAQCPAVQFIAASEKFLIVVPSGQQQLIRIWNRKTLQLLHGYYGHQKQISSIVYLNDKKHMASCSHDCTVRIWDLSNFKLNREIKKFAVSFPLLSLCQLNQDTIAFGGDDCLITVWNWKTETVKHKCFAHLGSVTSLRVCGIDMVCSTGGDNKIKVWKFGEEHHQTSKYLNKLQQFKKKLRQNIFTTNITKSQVLSIDSKGHVYLVNNQLEIGCSKLKIQYSQFIRSIKLWKNRLFVVIMNTKDHGELKEIAADFEELRTNAKRDMEARVSRQNKENRISLFDLNFKEVDWDAIIKKGTEMRTKDLTERLIADHQLPTKSGIEWQDYEQKERGNEPKITLSTLSLVILVPVLIVVQLRFAAFFAIPVLQYVYFSFLVSFLFNYLAIIRNFELMSYLPSSANDNRLKSNCVVLYAAIIMSVFIGWNGSGGILFAMAWESFKGNRIDNRMNSYKFFFLSVIVGSVLLENNYSAHKLLEFVPGILFGLLNTEISRLKASSPYAITHQLVFFCAMLFPVFFAASKFVVPSLGQWAVMLVGGFVMFFTIIAAIKLMQSGQASVVTAVSSGIIMAGTATYASFLDVFGLLLIANGIGRIIKEEYFQSDF